MSESGWSGGVGSRRNTAARRVVIVCVAWSGLLEDEHVAVRVAEDGLGGPGLPLWPAVELGACGVQPLVGDLQARKSAADPGSPAVDQLALASLLSSGDYERHVVRARHVYRRRRDLLLDALISRFPRLQISGAAAGMQLLLPLPGRADDSALAEAAAARGIGITALSPLHLAQSPDRGLLLGFGRLTEHKIPLAFDALSTVLNETGAAPSPRARPRR